MVFPHFPQHPSPKRNFWTRNPQRSMSSSPQPGQKVFSPVSPGTLPV
jgi:hypothetical protein